MAKSLGHLNRDLRRRTQSAARHAAVEIMNDLAEAGPNWSGRFKNSWVADSPGAAIGKSGRYPYKVSDVAKLKDTIKAVEQNPKLVIYNTTDYALIAMDLKEGKFMATEEPKGAVVEEGKRPTNKDGLGIRGDVSGSGNNRSTAELDWFMNYIDGGGMQKALAVGAKIGFKKEVK